MKNTQIKPLRKSEAEIQHELNMFGIEELETRQEMAPVSMVFWEIFRNIKLGNWLERV